MEQISFLLLDSASTGVLVAFVAIGYSLVYGILRFVNFAHGEVLAASAFLTMEICRLSGIQALGPALLIGAVVGGVTGMSIERVVYRPLRHKGALVLLLASFAVSMAMQASMSLIWGSRSRSFGMMEQTLSLAGGEIYLREAILPALLLLAAIALEFGLRFTVWGLAVRGMATAADQVEYIGVPVNRVVLKTFALAGALAGVAGVVVAMRGGLSPSLGFRFSLWAFAGTVVGGLGNLRGTLIGGFLLGVLLSIWARFASALYLDGAAFAAMALVLLVRPEGLFTFLDREV